MYACLLLVQSSWSHVVDRLDPLTPDPIRISLPHLEIVPLLGHVFSSHDVPVDSNLDGVPDHPCQGA
jgi:hypothetical protein